MTVFAAYNNMRSRSIAISALRLEQMQELDGFGLQVQAIFQSGDFMIHHRATDKGSRTTTRWWGWQLGPQLFQIVLQMGGLAQSTVVDMMCQKSTSQSELFVSRDPAQGMLWSNAFALPWTSKNNQFLPTGATLFFFPPPRLIPKMVASLLSQAVTSAVVIVPSATDKAWFRQLYAMSIDRPVILPTLDQILDPPEGSSNAQDTPPTWTPIAFFLSGIVELREEFLRTKRTCGNFSTQVRTVNGYARAAPNSYVIAKVETTIQQICQESR